MLKNIPRIGKITTRQLVDILATEGFSTTQRTVQRDLNTLSLAFADLTTDSNPDKAGWFWRKNAAVQDFPAIDSSMALSFKLIQTFFNQMIPPQILSNLKPYFACADTILNSVDNPGLKGWADKVRIIPRTQRLIPAAILEKTISVVYQSLLDGTKFCATYQGRNGQEKKHEFHPLGLVFRNSTVYLVATLWDYESPRHFALHRFKGCALTEHPVKSAEGFLLDEYIAGGAFEYAEAEGKQIKLKAVFSSRAGFHLTETPLSEDQELIHKKDGRVQIKATVIDGLQLRWWLRGFAEEVEIISPKRLRQEFVEGYQKALSVYSD